MKLGTGLGSHLVVSDLLVGLVMPDRGAYCGAGHRVVARKMANASTDGSALESSGFRGGGNGNRSGKGCGKRELGLHGVSVQS